MHDPRKPFDARYAGIYDLIYAGRGKDYDAEAAELTSLIREHRPAAASLLDVACGTGRHLESFATMFDHVEGAELADDMLAVARTRLPEVPLHLADMRHLDLGRTFDGVTCLFAATGHLRTTAELNTVAERLVAHAVPGGVVIVEPWWFPDNFLPDYVTGDVVTEDGATIARVSHTTEQDRVTTMEVHYVVASPGVRPRHFTNTVVNTLFTREEYEHALSSAGCTVRYLPEGPSGRGRFVAVRG